MRTIKKIFLGGTCNGSLWRNEFQKKLKVPYFNPVVEEWTDEAKQIEDIERDRCRFSVYVITPKMNGFYSIAEVIDDCYNKRKKTFFCYLPEDDGLQFNNVQLRSLKAVGDMVVKIGGTWASDLNRLAEILNQFASERKR